MPDNLPKYLPPRRMIDHEIEMLPGGSSDWQKFPMGQEFYSKRRKMEAYGCASTIEP
ncbi:hypothetical protein E6C27_scaffold382G001240 [Cucumis melo var. makuwa]|uniref:Uncharacterized protein n=1 Tax=Cucumis melo var. makuwa TaxID=1194695 RepID=A0A5A7V6A3_CUCMM|nr:hypothetical protein E6C27_scaffold382G001240 [Cucumis melo var. makuwa]